MPLEIQRRIIKFQGTEPISSILEVDHYKDRVAVQLQFDHLGRSRHYLTYMNFYGSDLIDVGIQILAMKELDNSDVFKRALLRTGFAEHHSARAWCSGCAALSVDEGSHLRPASALGAFWMPRMRDRRLWGGLRVRLWSGVGG